MTDDQYTELDAALEAVIAAARAHLAAVKAAIISGKIVPATKSPV